MSFRQPPYAGTNRPDRYTLTDLEEMTGVSGRTIRYYITEGLLSPAYGRGPSATYDEDHYLRLQAVQHFKSQRLPLKSIKDELANLTTDDLAMMINAPAAPEVAVWKHHQLHSDLLIAVRDRGNGEQSAAHGYAFDLIVEYARGVLADLDPTNGGGEP